jgi:selenocysteine lyase/cysteine desulfurase
MKENKDIFRPLLKEGSSFEDINKLIIGENNEKYFDYTASGLGFQPIEERVQEVLDTYANTHSEVASNSKITSSYYSTARENIKKHLGLGNDFVLLPCGNGATGAIKKFQELLGIYIPPATRKRFKFEVMNIDVPLVIVGPFEHHSNEISYREGVCDVVRVPLDSSGNVNLRHLASLLKKNRHRQVIGAFSIASNVTGIISPYEKISKLFRKNNAILAFDCAAASPCLNIDSSLYDAFFLSPHKLLGGPGSCGLLAIRKSIIDTKLSPSFAGGGTVTYVSKDDHEFNSDIETREDAGTPAILQLIRAALAYQLRDEIGLEKIQQRKTELINILDQGVLNIEGNTIYSKNDTYQSIGILAVNFDKVSPYDLCEKLSDEYGIQTRAGCSCAGPYGQDLIGFGKNYKAIKERKEKPSWLRVSLNYTHSPDGIGYLLSSLEKSVEELRR